MVLCPCMGRRHPLPEARDVGERPLPHAPAGSATLGWPWKGASVCSKPQWENQSGLCSHGDLEATREARLRMTESRPGGATALPMVSAQTLAAELLSQSSDP